MLGWAEARAVKIDDRYRILQSLGAGAAGGVYLVADRFRGGPPLALKRIHARADDLLRASFEREFVALSGLSLPGVARVIDFGLGADPDGDGDQGPADQPFFTRTFVAGRSLAEALADAQPVQRVGTFLEVLRVVAPLHRMGVTHGDLKPGNIIVDDGGGAHVIDFGLAQLPTDQTRQRGVGTPEFMAPELLRGGAPSVATDVYALGATLWTSLAGAPPFANLGHRALAARLAGARPEVPPDLDDLSQRALAVAVRALDPDPLARLPTVEELHVALAELLPGRASGKKEPDLQQRGFVAPRPRGHEDVLAQLDARVTARVDGAAQDQAAVVLAGGRGGGKSTVLRELKWRLQVRGVRVIEVSIRDGVGLAPVVAAMRQARLFAGEESAGGDQQAEDGAVGTQHPGSDPVAAACGDGMAVQEQLLAEELGRLLVAVTQRGKTAVLVDDLDAAEHLVSTCLRMAIHADGAERVALVATAVDPGLPGLLALGARSLVELPALDQDDIAALCADALGPADPALVRALEKHSRGVPGILVDALSVLARRHGATAEDVLALPVGDAGEAAAVARLTAVDAAIHPMLEALAVVGVPVNPELLLAGPWRRWREGGRGAGSGGPTVHGEHGVEDDRMALQAAVEAGVLAHLEEKVVLADRGIAAVLLERLGHDAVVERAQGLLNSDFGEALAPGERARLAVRAEDEDAIRTLVPVAVAALRLARAHRLAIDLLEAFITVARPEQRNAARLELSELCETVGRYEEARRAALSVIDDESASAEQRARAAVLSGRAATAEGRFDEAVGVLRLVPVDADATTRAGAFSALAKVHLRRGDYDAVQDAVAAGLACAKADDAVRIELLTSAGMVESYRGDHNAARAQYHEALVLAEAAGSERDQANVRTYLAIDHHRAGDHRTARDLYEQSLAMARRLGDVGGMATFALNLGAISFELGQLVKSAEHYEMAARYARRAAKASTDVMARVNLANLHVYLGLHERARMEADSAFNDASEAGMKLAAAQASAVLGDVAARLGDVDTALMRYDDAIARYRNLGQRREMAEWTLDAAAALLDRGGPADGSAAAARLAEAREIIQGDDLEEFSLKLRLLLARARADAGDEVGALAELDEVIRLSQAPDQQEVLWQALSAKSVVHTLRGDEVAQRQSDHQAMEVLESIATRLPRDFREPFWHDPRRREVRRRLGIRASQEVQVQMQQTSTFHGAPLEARAARLLEIIKRLASERDMDRLLERITDSAIELSGAERGFVLLVDPDGKLEPKLVRTAGMQAADPHVAFSQSIAEAVLIDGEPIITIDARDDRRLNEYMSVHKLMLKSVACLPIRGRLGTAGVLYLEHRMRRGRFEEADIDLLFAFADQAAIALENARLMAENERRTLELEQANVELAAANAEVERVLMARTAELQETQIELDRARQELRGAYERHGIVGNSAAMRAVFAVVDRVREASVPVVIQGESGTGKELVARAIHYGGPRSKAPFVAINCAAIPEPLLESELFGHVRGAFTGADRDKRGVMMQANGGTLFLDEVGDMPSKMQVDLLRVLQDGRVRPVGGDRDEQVEVRIIAASNKSLADLVAKGQFREDLYYRLNVVELRLPPLRERPEDVPLLCDHFLQKFAERDGVEAKRISRDALARLAEHPMPGNVRQLEHVLLNAWVLVEGPVIGREDLALDGSSGTSASVAQERVRLAVAAAEGRDAEPSAASFGDYKTQEKQRILAALESCGWNRVKAAKALGMPRRTFYRRLTEYEIL